MKHRLFGALMVALMGVSSACIVHTHNNRRCGPGYHWDNGGCRRNGHHNGGRGRDKVIIRDHRR